MSWASKRRTIYLGAILFVLGMFVAVPLAYWYFSIPETCGDGIQNQGETGIDIGGPCQKLDARYLQSEAVLWARSFKIRDGSYTAIAYIQNSNQDAGVQKAQYRFSLYDSENVPIAERIGTTYLMPGAITPVLEPSISTGNRIVARTYFELEQPLVWERLQNTATVLSINNKELSDALSTPRITADANNSAIFDVIEPEFVAVAFDTAGNAIAASRTLLPRITAGSSARIVFTWSDPFAAAVGRIDITSLTPPTP